jgi:hypothetical protein
MVLQPQRARVYSGSQSLDATSCVAQLEAELAQLMDGLRHRQVLVVASGLVAQRFVIIPEWDSTLAADNAGRKQPRC